MTKNANPEEFKTTPNQIESLMLQLGMVQEVIDFLESDDPYVTDVKDINRYGKAADNLVRYLDKFFDKKTMTSEQIQALKKFRQAGQEVEKLFDIETIKFLNNKREAIKNLKAIMGTIDEEFKRIDNRQNMDDSGLVDQFLDMQGLLGKFAIISLRGHYLAPAKLEKLNKKVISIIYEFNLQKTLTEMLHEK